MLPVTPVYYQTIASVLPVYYQCIARNLFRKGFTGGRVTMGTRTVPVVKGVVVLVPAEIPVALVSITAGCER